MIQCPDASISRILRAKHMHSAAFSRYQFLLFLCEWYLFRCVKASCYSSHLPFVVWRCKPRVLKHNFACQTLNIFKSPFYLTLTLGWIASWHIILVYASIRALFFLFHSILIRSTNLCTLRCQRKITMPFQVFAIFRQSQTMSSLLRYIPTIKETLSINKSIVLQHHEILRL